MYAFEKVYDATTHRTTVERVKTLEDVPCRCSFESATPATQTDDATAVSQEITLYLAPEVEILAGSEVEVTQNERTILFEASGTPRVYQTHQEIALISTDKKA